MSNWEPTNGDSDKEDKGHQSTPGASSAPEGWTPGASSAPEGWSPGGSSGPQGWPTPEPGPGNTPGGATGSGGPTWSPNFNAASSPPPDGGFTLRPLTVADVLDQTFSLFKKCWKLLLIAVLVYAVPAGIASGLSTSAQGHNAFNFTGAFTSNFSNPLSSSSNMSGIATALFFLSSLLNVVAAYAIKPVVEGAIVRIVASQYLGRPVDVKTAFRGVRPMFWRFVGASILVAVCSLGGLLFPIAILFTAVIPIIAIEEENAGNALGRSWALMKRRFWSYLLIRLAIVFIAGIAAVAVELAPAALAVLFDYLNLTPLAGLFLAIAGVLSSMVLLPIGAISITLIYFDARVRHEGFDLQMMASRLPRASNPQQ